MDSWVGTLLSLGLGIVYVAIGHPLYRQKVGPNPLYGFRIRQTLNDPDVWYPVNQRSGKHFIVTGLVLTLLGAVSLIVAQTENRQNAVLVMAVALALTGSFYLGVVCYRMARTLTTRRTPPSIRAG